MQPHRSRRAVAAVLSLGLAGLGVLVFPATASAATLTVTSSANGGTGSLREVIADAGEGDTITFADTITEVVLTSTITIDKSLSIQGPGMGELTITRPSSTGSAWSLFRVDGATIDLAFSGLTIANPDATTRTDAIVADDIHDLTLDGVRIARFNSQPGTVSLSHPSGDLIIRDSAFEQNYTNSSAGGAIHVWNSIADVTITGSTLTDNRANSRGGAVSLWDVAGDLIVSGSTFSGSQTGNNGNGGAMEVGIVGGSVEISDSTFESNDAEGDGGAIYLEGAGSTVTISGSEFLENHGDRGAGLWIGAVGEGFLVKDSAFRGNDANEGGGIYFGGSIPAGANVSILDSAFDENSGMGGGGILIQDRVLAPVVVSRSTFTSNHSIEGAGINEQRNSGTLTIEFCTFAGNRSDRGGAVSITRYGTAGETVTIANSTFVGNPVGEGDEEAGASVWAELGTGKLEIVNSTFDEQPQSDSTPYALYFRTRGEEAPRFTVRNSTIVAYGGIYLDHNAPVTDDPSVEISHTILDLLGGPAVAFAGHPATASIEWSILSGELDPAVTPGSGNQLNVASIGLGPLQDNGGPTMTMLPGAGSPAIGKGDPGFTGPAVDQRGSGFDRTVGVIDIGAVEVQAALASTGTADALPWFAGALGMTLAGALLLVVRRRRGRTSVAL
jgi:predicted outer membrane repeat protein